MKYFTPNSGVTLLISFPIQLMPHGFASISDGDKGFRSDILDFDRRHQFSLSKDLVSNFRKGLERKCQLFGKEQKNMGAKAPSAILPK